MRENLKQTVMKLTQKISVTTLLILDLNTYFKMSLAWDIYPQYRKVIAQQFQLKYKKVTLIKYQSHFHISNT